LQRQFGHHGVHTQTVLVFMANDMALPALVDAALSGLARGELITLLTTTSRTLHHLNRADDPLQDLKCDFPVGPALAGKAPSRLKPVPHLWLCPCQEHSETS
jgi:hypothetical protein